MTDDERLAIWPIFGIRIRTPRLELRPVDNDLAFELADLAARGIHDPSSTPFGRPWTDVPPDELRRNSVQYYWHVWADWKVDKWDLPFAVIEKGVVAGVQGLMSEHFPVLRAFETGSWLGKDFQGRGIGKEMRAAVVQFGFDGLRAIDAFTSAYDDNDASLGVTRSLGYEDNGLGIKLRRDQRAEMLAFRMKREDWLKQRRTDIVIDGLDAPCLEQFGLGADLEPLPKA